LIAWFGIDQFSDMSQRARRAEVRIHQRRKGNCFSMIHVRRLMKFALFLACLSSIGCRGLSAKDANVPTNQTTRRSLARLADIASVTGNDEAQRIARLTEMPFIER